MSATQTHLCGQGSGAHSPPGSRRGRWWPRPVRESGARRRAQARSPADREIV